MASIQFMYTTELTITLSGATCALEHPNSSKIHLMVYFQNYAKVRIILFCVQVCEEIAMIQRLD